MGAASIFNSAYISVLQNFYSIGFRIDNESISAVGYLDGYRFTISIEGFDYMVSTSIRREGLLPDEDFLNSIVNEVRTVKGAVYQNNRVTFMIRKNLSTNSLVSSIIEAMHGIAAILKKNGYVNVCEICGESVDSIESYDINGRVFDLCDNCHEDCEAYVKARKCLDDSKKENIPLGMLLGLLGGFFGASFIVLSVATGSISTWLGACISMCLLVGYLGGSGKMSRFGLAYSGVLLIALSYLSVRLGYAIRYVNLTRDYGGDVELWGAFVNIHGILEKFGQGSAIIEAVIYCCVFGYCLIGAEVVMMLQKRKTKTTDIIIEIPEEDRFYNAG